MVAESRNYRDLRPYRADAAQAKRGGKPVGESTPSGSTVRDYEAIPPRQFDQLFADTVSDYTTLAREAQRPGKPGSRSPGNFDQGLGSDTGLATLANQGALAIYKQLNLKSNAQLNAMRVRDGKQTDPQNITTLKPGKSGPFRKKRRHEEEDEPEEAARLIGGLVGTASVAKRILDNVSSKRAAKLAAQQAAKELEKFAAQQLAVEGARAAGKHAARRKAGKLLTQPILSQVESQVEKKLAQELTGKLAKHEAAKLARFSSKALKWGVRLASLTGAGLAVGTAAAGGAAFVMELYQSKDPKKAAKAALHAAVPIAAIQAFMNKDYNGGVVKLVDHYSIIPGAGKLVQKALNNINPNNTGDFIVQTAGNVGKKVLKNTTAALGHGLEQMLPTAH